MCSIKEAVSCCTQVLHQRDNAHNKMENFLFLKKGKIKYLKKSNFNKCDCKGRAHVCVIMKEVPHLP